MERVSASSSAPLRRRDFLKAATHCAAAGPAIVAASRLAAAGQPSESKPHWTMHLSTSSSHFHQLTFEQACERIAKLGFEGLDIWSPHMKVAHPNNCTHLYEVAHRFGAKGLKEVLAKNKLKLCAFTVYAEGAYPQYAELLGQVGGGVAIRGSLRTNASKDLARRMRAFMEELKPQIELAHKYNSYLAIENHADALLHTPDSFKAFVDTNTSPRLGIALAPYHLQTINASVPDVINTCGKQLFFFYAWQHAEGTDQLPGHGPTDFTPWMAALAQIGYARYANPFMHGELAPEPMSAALAKARTYLTKCYDAAISHDT